jgi:hypothetical protein
MPALCVHKMLVNFNNLINVSLGNLGSYLYLVQAPKLMQSNL